MERVGQVVMAGGLAAVIDGDLAGQGLGLPGLSALFGPEHGGKLAQESRCHGLRCCLRLLCLWLLGVAWGGRQRCYMARAVGLGRSA